MLLRCKRDAGGITKNRFYEFKWETGKEHIVIVNNQFQLVAYPKSYFDFKDKDSKEIMHDKLRAMLRSKTFFTV